MPAEANPSTHGIIDDMTLATRCSACGTSFRVAQDQLRASGGWVRCGRCNEVFNAIEGLYEIGAPIVEPDIVAGPRAAPSDSQAASRAGATADDSPLRDYVATAPVPDAVARVLAPRAVEPPDFESSTHAGSSTFGPLDMLQPLPEGDCGPYLPRASDHEAAGIDAEIAPGVQPEIEIEIVGTPSPAYADDEPLAVESVRPGDDIAPDELAPSFVRAAQRAERWQQPGRRRLLAFVSLLLALGLVAQATFAYRDVVASRWPALRAPLTQACAVIGCSVEPLRHIAALAVDSSGLQQVGAEPVYKLSVTLRNRGGIELMVPSLDLVLTDAQGRMIARRVLTMAELGRPSRTMAAQSETSGQVSLSTGEQRVSGYTIEIFYP